jgi:hypothetical protein
LIRVGRSRGQTLYLQRNVLAHRRLPDIDEDRVWRDTVLRAEQYQADVRSNLS